ncbi:hypothetical protein JFL43_07520 [Viridibacillus sp. YIM B01967]|uniref:Helix-turn-helix conjugative transposon-like domain-containing protein n=1 Tax=Viridibacillus soli TaxID=2798301 RepID=A0ABS1H5L4_9BACL|nr:hypothetical protein [Viridibacillus soli]
MHQVENKDLERLLEIFRPAIKKSLHHTRMQEREDLEQEISMKILEKLNYLQDIKTPDFFEFIEYSID